MKRSGFKGLVAAGLVAASVASSTSVVSASDMFLKIAGVTGESTDEKHKGWIEVLSWSWGTSQSTGKTRKGVAPSQCINDLVFTKYVDSSSPQLIMNAVLGQAAKDATLTMRKAGKDQQEFLIIKMQDVLVSSYQTGANAGNEAQLTDAIVLSFSSISGEYRPVSDDGKVLPAVTFEINSDCPSK